MSRFEISRTSHVQADPARLRGLIEDFREWTKWSPWEDVDPALQRSYTGPDKGVGAHYEWSGNRKAGQGGMEITAVTPERIEVLLTFVKPWKATNRVAFEPCNWPPRSPSAASEDGAPSPPEPHPRQSKGPSYGPTLAR